MQYTAANVHLQTVPILFTACSRARRRETHGQAPPVQSATCGDSDHLANWLYDQCAPGSNGEKETCEGHEDYEANWCAGGEDAN